MTATASARPVRFLVAGAVAAVAAVVGAVLVPLSAQAAPIELSGTVVGATGSGLKDVTITALEYEGSPTPDSVATTETATGGAFTFATLEAGTYTLSFGATTSTYAQYLGNTTDVSAAQELTLAEGAGNHSFITAALSGSGAISGKVRTTTGSDLDGYTVEAFHDGADGDRSLAASVTSSSSGSYSIAGLVPGQYQVEASDAAAKTALYAPQFGGGASELGDSNVYDVVAGASQTVDFSLGKSGSIAGTVTGLTGSTVENLPGVRVTPYYLGPTDDPASAFSIGARSVLTATDGTYSVTGLAPGYYTLEFAAPTTSNTDSGTVYGRSFLGSADSVQNSTTLLVSTDSTIRDENIQLVASATISGEVVDAAHPSGAGLPNIRVTLDHDGQTASTATSDGAPTVLTDANGDFSFPGLGAGQYTFTVGSASDETALAGEDTTWQREQENVENVVSSGETTCSETVTVTKKDPAGLHPTTAPSISVVSTLAAGGTLTADPGDWSPAIDSIPLYQWYRDGMAISGATGSSYELEGGDVGASIAVRVTGYNFAYGSASAMSAASADVAPGTGFESLNNATIAGTPTIDHVLTAVPGLWILGSAQENPLFSYQWQSSPDNSTWTNIANETGPALTVSGPDLDAGPYLRVSIVGTLQGYNLANTDSASVTGIPGTITETKAPTLTTSSSEWSLSAGSWSPSAGTNTLTWSVFTSDGTLFETVNGSELSRTGLAGMLVEVQVQRTLDGYTNYLTTQLVVQKGSAPLASGATTITASADQVGVEMDAPLPTWTPSISAEYFQWQRGSGVSWTNISDANADEYVPTPTDLGKAIRVVLTTYLAGYPSGNLVTSPTGVVQQGAAPTFTGTASIRFSGTVETNNEVDVEGVYWSGTPPTVSYQWATSADGGTTLTSIAGATADHLIIPSTVAGQELFVTIMATTPGRQPGHFTFGGDSISKGAFLLTKAPTVKKSGSNFVVSTGSWVPAPTTYSYQWDVFQPDGSVLPTITTSPTFPISSAGTQHLIVEVNPSGSTATEGFAGPYNAQTGTLTPVGSLALVAPGNGAVGTILSAPPISGWTNVTSPAVAYQWEYESGSTWKAITGADTSAFAPLSSYLGKKLRVTLTASAPGYTTKTVDSLSVTVAATSSALTHGVSVHSPVLGVDLVSGGVATISPGTWSDAAAKFSYQWGIDVASSFVPMAGATGSSFTIPGQYTADTLAVKITATAAGYQPGTDTVSASSVIAEGTLTNSVAPKVTASSSGRLTATAGTWNSSDPTLDFKWDVVSTTTGSTLFEQDGASDTYAPPSGTTGDFIRLTVAATGTGFVPGSVSVIARTGAAIAPTEPLTVNGDFVVGDTLTAAEATWAPGSPAVTYQWYRGSTKITGATDASYQLASADVDEVISVDETATEYGYATSTHRVTAGTALGTLTPINYQIPSISGSAVVDGTLTVNPGPWNVSGLTFTYAWFRGDAVIPGATGKSYVPTSNDQGEELSALVTAHRTGYTSPAVSTGWVVVAPGALLAPSKFTLPATDALGTKLTPSLGSWNFPVTTVYDWQYEPPAAMAWDDIAGASGNTYTPSTTDGLEAGGSVRLVILASRPGHPTSSVTSTPVTIQ